MEIGFDSERYGTVELINGKFVYGGESPDKVKKIVENISKEENLTGKSLLNHIKNIQSSYFWVKE